MDRSSLFEQDLLLSGHGVSLRPLTGNDSVALARAAEGLKSLHPFSFVPAGTDGACNYVETALSEKAAGERYPLLIVFRGLVADTTSYLDFSWWQRPGVEAGFPAAVEIGATWLAGFAQRTSCNTEAKYLLLTHAFETWRVERVSFRTDERNTRSRAAIERIGACFEGIRRAERLGADGAIRNSASYSIIAAEWPAAKAQLAARLA